MSFNTSLAYVDKDGNHPKQKRVRDIGEAVFDAKPNGMYAVQFDYVGRSSRHIVSVERDAGGIKIYDPQTGKVYSNRGGN